MTAARSATVRADRPDSRFAVRTPLLPFEVVEGWASGLDLPSRIGTAGFEESYRHWTTKLRERLRELVTDPVVADALLIASPSLAERLPEWERAPTSARGRKIELALVRYVMRMSARPTPFGLFSGCSIGDLGDATHFEIAPRARYQRHTRLDMDYLFSLCSALSRDPEVRDSLRYRTTTSLYRVAEAFRYFESRLVDKTRSYKLVNVDPTPYLDAVLGHAAEGGATQAELCELITRIVPDVSEDEAREFVGALIDTQMLVSSLAPAVTGREPIHGLIELLHETPAIGADAAARLKNVRRRLEEIDHEGLGVQAASYRAVASELEPLPVPVEVSRLFQVDLVKPAHRLELSRRVADDALSAVAFLARFRPDGGAHPALAEFAKAFEERYGESEVPLCEALDEQSGVGFDAAGRYSEEAPLLHDFAFPTTAPADKVSFTATDRRLLRKLEMAYAQGSDEIVLDDGDLPRAASGGDATSAAPLPDAFAITLAIGASSAEAVDRGDYDLVFKSAAGPSGMRMLARFCHADPAVETLVRSHLEAEERLMPDAIFAEVVHLPEGRTGNVLCRPVLRKYEIPFLGQSCATEANQIPVTDLMVSVLGGQATLRSRRFNRRVLPRITNAHNLAQAGLLGIYRFLGALQSQGVAASVGWSWGIFAHASFLPRVRIGRAVVARARWLFDEEELSALASAADSERFVLAQDLRRARRMPRFVLLVDGDRELLIDFDNPLSVDAFIELVDGREAVALSELLPGPDALLCTGREGRFTHELVLSFVRSPLPPTPARRPTSPVDVSPRRIAPGGECLYLKVYGGTADTDMFLARRLAPVIRGAARTRLIERWFFIRYADPRWHLRLRFFGEAKRLMGELLPALNDCIRPAMDRGAVWKAELDTYDPELHRYGGRHGINLAEELFCVDSDAVLSILEQLESDEGAVLRWQLALRGIDMLLDGLGVELGERREVLGRLRQSYRAEFRVEETALEHQLGARFRVYRQVFEELFDPRSEDIGALARGLAIWRERSARLAPIGAALRERAGKGLLTQPLEALWPSYIHMFTNRILNGGARAQELILYEYLDRLYESQDARRRHATRPRARTDRRSAE